MTIAQEVNMCTFSGFCLTFIGFHREKKAISWSIIIAITYHIREILNLSSQVHNIINLRETNILIEQRLFLLLFRYVVISYFCSIRSSVPILKAIILHDADMENNCLKYVKVNTLKFFFLHSHNSTTSLLPRLLIFPSFLFWQLTNSFSLLLHYFS